MSTTLQEVQAAYDATMVANGNDPYVHALYVEAEENLRDVNMAYYGAALAEFALDVQHNCGEVWPREKLVEHHRQELVSGLAWEVTMAVHVRTDEETGEYFAKIAKVAAELKAADPNLDLEALMTKVIAEGVRGAAMDHGIEL